MDIETAKKLFPVGCIVGFCSWLPGIDKVRFLAMVLKINEQEPSHWQLPRYNAILEVLWQDGIMGPILPDRVERLPDNPYHEIYLTARVMARMVGKSWEPFGVP